MKSRSKAGMPSDPTGAAPTFRRGRSLSILLIVALASASALITWLNLRGDHQGPTPTVLQPGPQQAEALISRGRELALLGNCAGCHTTPGGAAYAGGSALLTPFGTVYGGNLTPDPETGLGQWTSQDFWRALHNGRSRNGRLLNPAFPYENFSHIRRKDSDALYAYLQSLPPARQAAPRANLRFPANTQAGLAIWRALHFHPQEPSTPIAMPRGEYLSRGVAHCSACHATRNTLGAQSATHDFSGQLMPNGRAYAPPLPPQGRTDVGAWTVEDLTAYLKTGHSRQGAALGLMAEVVVGSTQHVPAESLEEMATWILSRPSAAKANPPPTRAHAQPAPPSATLPTSSPNNNRNITPTGPLMALGERLYADHCATCHGQEGQGVPGLYPPLAGSPRVARDPATNLIRVIQEGGFGPATEGHPRPFGMPPFGHVLQAQEVAAVATFVRRQWNGASLAEVTPLEVLKHR